MAAIPKIFGEGVNDDILFLWMEEAGYQNYYVGKLWNFHSVDKNGKKLVRYTGQCSTTVVIVVEKSLTGLREPLEKEDPFFLTVAPIALHSNWLMKPKEDLSYLEESESTSLHEHFLEDYGISRTENFNAPVIGGAGWTKGFPLNDTILRAAVDEMLPQLIQELKEAGQLNNTHVFYTTDNSTTSVNMRCTQRKNAD
ncbi:alkaline-phosphatase-like protein [Xylaria venustula]|nr:alkaline-phosphatase-like protein [Xylaria venustula]